MTPTTTMIQPRASGHEGNTLDVEETVAPAASATTYQRIAIARRERVVSMPVGRASNTWVEIAMASTPAMMEITCAVACPP
jgi:hypothetical protein